MIEDWEWKCVGGRGFRLGNGVCFVEKEIVVRIYVIGLSFLVIEKYVDRVNLRKY